MRKILATVCFVGAFVWLGISISEHDNLLSFLYIVIAALFVAQTAILLNKELNDKKHGMD